MLPEGALPAPLREQSVERAARLGPEDFPTYSELAEMVSGEDPAGFVSYDPAGFTVMTRDPKAGPRACRAKSVRTRSNEVMTVGWHADVEWGNLTLARSSFASARAAKAAMRAQTRGMNQCRGRRPWYDGSLFKRVIPSEVLERVDVPNGGTHSLALYGVSELGGAGSPYPDTTYAELWVRTGSIVMVTFWGAEEGDEDRLTQEVMAGAAAELFYEHVVAQARTCSSMCRRAATSSLTNRMKSA